ncbi:E3 ubiquitin/ISG15 ligase TRIM25-like, partial [Ruditapes philippinarum]|uniref:E3 ubiquitin/ISG15 ligase TRIM25-like n=1 Tax=Ruditapes philippinarum TaxID=129788 RepID=UPI00295C04E9
MEVSGKLGHDDSTLVCIPCDRDAVKEPAYGFCQDCQEHLCETCYKHHRRARPLRNHVLIDKESMPKTRAIASSTSDDTVDHCEKHLDKPLEFYCRDHKLVACYVCVTLEHKQCKVNYIPDVSENMSDEMTDVLEQLESFIKRCKSKVEYVNKAARNLDQSHAKVVEDIKVFRKEINECLDRMENQIFKEADLMVNSEKSKEETVLNACLEITEELECSHSLLIALREENKQNKLFIEMKNAEKRLPILTDKEVQVLDANTTIECIQFTRNTSLLDRLKNEIEFGTLLTCVQPSPDKTLNLQYDHTLNVKFKSDKKQCHILGIAMIAPMKIIVADNANNSIKMIDVETKSVIIETILSSQPYDVIAIPGNKLAVTLTNEKCIQLLSHTEAEFSLDRRIAVGENCSGVAYCQNKFVVSCRASKKIIIINDEGNILNVLGSPAMFYGPVRVSVRNDETFLYVSDTDFENNSKVVKIDWEG